MTKNVKETTEEHTCDTCESLFVVTFVDGMAEGEVTFCPFCGSVLDV